MASCHTRTIGVFAAMRVFYLLPLLLSSPLLLGCDSSIDELVPFELDIQLDKESYSLTGDTGVTVTIKNNSDVPVYVLAGGYLGFEQQVDRDWVFRGTWFTVDAAGPTFPLQPGFSINDFLPMRHLQGQEGTYRFVYLLFRDPAGDQPLSSGDRTSPTFDVGS